MENDVEFACGPMWTHGLIQCRRITATPAGGEWYSEPWRNWPFRRETLHAVHCPAKGRPGLTGDVIILARCQSLIISDIRPCALKILMPHGKACRSRALQLERNMTAQYL